MNLSLVCSKCGCCHTDTGRGDYAFGLFYCRYCGFRNVVDGGRKKRGLGK